MDIAGHGEIHHFCQPNSILTLMEYIEDHGSGGTRGLGEERIRSGLSEIGNVTVRRETEKRLERIRNGERDLYF